MLSDTHNFADLVLLERDEHPVI